MVVGFSGNVNRVDFHPKIVIILKWKIKETVVTTIGEDYRNGRYTYTGALRSDKN
jgi:hypothetical protein